MKTQYDSDVPSSSERRLDVERRGFSYSRYIPERRRGHNRRQYSDNQGK